MMLSDEQVAFFRDQGYLALEAITTSEELSRLSEMYDVIMLERNGRDRGTFLETCNEDGDVGFVHALDPIFRFPAVAEATFLRTARRVAAQVLGVPEGDVRTFPSLMHKPARRGIVTPWHQDESVMDPALDHRTVTVWMPLEDVSVERGAMQFLPGSHRGPVLEHSLAPVPGLRVQIDTSTAVPCPLPAGGATLHHCRTLHHTQPNTSGEPRRAVVTRCVAPPLRRETPDHRPSHAEHVQETLARRASGSG